MLLRYVPPFSRRTYAPREEVAHVCSCGVPPRIRRAMSTRMYNYRLPKDAWWDFARACRAAYLEEHPISMAFSMSSKSAQNLDPEGKAERMGKILDTLKNLNEWMVDLQLFDEGNTYLIRPLERGYFFLNHRCAWEESFGLEPVFYDDRSDVPPEQEPNREVSRWCDEKIEAGEYLMYSVASEDTLSKVFFDTTLNST